MNDLAREKLIQAQLNGVKQAYGRMRTRDGKMCAMGVLGFRDEQTVGQAEQLRRKYDISDHTSRNARIQCPECSNKFMGEFGLGMHLNDKHQFDFLTIARKLP